MREERGKEGGEREGGRGREEGRLKTQIRTGNEIERKKSLDAGKDYHDKLLSDDCSVKLQQVYLHIFFKCREAKQAPLLSTASLSSTRQD